MKHSHLFRGALVASVGLLAGCPGIANLPGATGATPAPGSSVATGSAAATGSTTPAAANLMALNVAHAGMPANSWTVGSPMAHERVGLSAGALNGRLYVIGGDGEATMELYDPQTDDWQLQPLGTTASPEYGSYAPNRTRYFGSAIVASGRLFYVGGTSNRLQPLLDIYDPEAATWLDLWSPYYQDAKFARMANGAVNLNGVLYLVGGLMAPPGGGDPVPAADVYAFSTLSEELYLKPDLPSPRAGLGAAVLDQRIYAVGGYSVLPTSGTAIATSSMVCYSAGEWGTATPGGTPLASLNVPRHSFGSAVLNGKWYVAGGVDSTGKVLDSVEEYDPATNAWTLKAPMPLPRVHLALSALGERLYAMGGYDAQNRQLRSMDVFRP